MSFNTPQASTREQQAPVSLLFTPPYRGTGGDGGKGTPVLSHLGRSPSTTPGTFGLGRAFSKGDQPSSSRRKSLTPASSMARDTPPPPPGDSLMDSPGVAGPSFAAWPPSTQTGDVGGGVEDMVIVPRSTGQAIGHTPPQQQQRQFAQASRAFQEYNDTWVTIFGFVQNDISLVLREFGKCGDIVHFGTFGDGPSVNWMHIKYANKHAAQRALLRNGDTLSAACMVGVKPIEASKRQDLEQQLSSGEVSTKIGGGASGSGNGAVAMTVPKAARVRSYQLEASAGEVTVVPLASKSAWEKVSEFILGL